MTIIDLCQYPGLPKTALMSFANVNYDVLIDLLFGLVDRELIKKETRQTSFDGQKRVTDWYHRTPEGDDLYIKFKEIEEKLTISGSH